MRNRPPTAYDGGSHLHALSTPLEVIDSSGYHVTRGLVRLEALLCRAREVLGITWMQEVEFSIADVFCEGCFCL